MAIDTRVNGYSHTPYKVRRIIPVDSRMVDKQHLPDYTLLAIHTRWSQTLERNQFRL